MYAKLPKCPKCNGEGFVFVNSGKIAGFRFNPPSVKWISANGFSVNKKMLEVLQYQNNEYNHTWRRKENV